MDHKYLELCMPAQAKKDIIPVPEPEITQMALSKLKIISRESPLAMWQAQHVRDKLMEIYTGMEIEIIGIKTQADKFLNMTLGEMGGKGAFVKELEQALLYREADLAVHSMKDVTIELPDGLGLPVILKREDVRDVFVSNAYESLEQLPEHARIGTSSLRRQCQLKAYRPDLEIVDIRGNLGTRLKKLDDGLYDGLILAAAGVKRLGLHERIRQFLDTGRMLPAIGQGALGLETRADDLNVIEVLSVLNDEDTHVCVAAERSFNRVLNGGCHAPVAAHADIEDSRLSITGLVGSLDGNEIIRSSATGLIEEGKELGDKLGREFIQRGAHKLLLDAGHG